MENKNTCFNCCHFVQHYAKFKFYLMKLECGSCRKTRVHDYCRRHDFFKSSRCPKWEPVEIQIAERRESIEEQLAVIIKKLTAIACILQSDDEEPRK